MFYAEIGLVHLLKLPFLLEDRALCHEEVPGLIFGGGVCRGMFLAPLIDS